MPDVRDVLVVGGGPVGLYAALEAAQAGLDVAVLDARAGVIDKACGEGLMPAAVAALERHGVCVPSHREFVGIRYVDGAATVEGRFLSGPGHGVRRTVLHAALRTRAIAAGIPLLEHRACRIAQDDDGVAVDGMRARHVIAADGLRSLTRRSLGLEAPSQHAERFGLRRHYRVAPWTDHVEVHWHELGEAYVTPVADDEVGIALLFDARSGQGARDFGEMLERRFPALAERVQGSDRSSMVRGAGPFEQRSSRVAAGRVLLVGDAAGYLDPITSEGLRLGFHAAIAAVACIAGDRVAAYDLAWKRIVRRYWWGTSALLALRRSPLRRLMIPALQRIPGLFDAILSELGDAAIPAVPGEPLRTFAGMSPRRQHRLVSAPRFRPHS